MRIISRDVLNMRQPRYEITLWDHENQTIAIRDNVARIDYGVQCAGAKEYSDMLQKLRAEDETFVRNALDRAGV